MADLFLDTYPYGSHSTALDMARTGVPVVTLAGATMASRIAASANIALGVPSLVASSRKQYFDIAYMLSQSPNKLATARLQLKQAVYALNSFAFVY